MIRHGKRQARDDDLRKGVAGDVDSGPEAVGAKKNRVALGPHLLGEFGAGCPGALQQKRPARRRQSGLQFERDRAHVGVARKED